MKGKRISREAALRIGAIGLAAVATIAILPGLLAPPEPPPLAADIGLGASGPTGAAGAAAPKRDGGRRDGKDARARKPKPSPGPPVRRSKPNGTDRTPGRDSEDREGTGKRPSEPPPAAPPAPAPAPTPAPGPPPPPAVPVPAPAPLPPPPAPSEFGP